MLWGNSEIPPSPLPLSNRKQQVESWRKSTFCPSVSLEVQFNCNKLINLSRYKTSVPFRSLAVIRGRVNSNIATTHSRLAVHSFVAHFVSCLQRQLLFKLEPLERSKRGSSHSSLASLGYSKPHVAQGNNVLHISGSQLQNIQTLLSKSLLFYIL